MTLRLLIRSKRHAGATQPVLQGVALTLARRGIVAVLGPSGCGKTTLLRIIAGLDRDFDGTLQWQGAAPRIGLVFQEPRLLPWRSVRDNLRLVLPDPALMVQADALLLDLGLWEARDALPARLSLGMARRVAIARALAIAPGLLLLDEPFVSLDPAAAEAARTAVRGTWRSREMAIVLVTHEAAEAAAVADRVLVLAPRPGRIVADIAVTDEERRRDGTALVEKIRAAQTSGP